MLMYDYPTPELNHTHGYLLPTVMQHVRGRVFDLGCGNGSVANFIAKRGFDVCGIDPSTQGIEQANRAFPDLDLRIGSADDDLSATFGKVSTVISLEVVEHLYDPKKFARAVFDLLDDGGTAIISTPYHGYLKNLALAATGSLDAHFTALWDGGHIKFWSVKTLTALLQEAGFNQIRFYRVGRIPVFAKSMIAIAER